VDWKGVHCGSRPQQALAATVDHTNASVQQRNMLALAVVAMPVKAQVSTSKAAAAAAAVAVMAVTACLVFDKAVPKQAQSSRVSEHTVAPIPPIPVIITSSNIHHCGFYQRHWVLAGRRRVHDIYHHPRVHLRTSPPSHHPQAAWCHHSHPKVRPGGLPPSCTACSNSCLAAAAALMLGGSNCWEGN
jgi:hypothetical protein